MPFTDNHQINLDWILAKMREVLNGLGEMVGYKEDAEEAAAAAAESATEASGSANSAQTQAAAAASSASAAQTSASQAQANAQQALTTTPISTDFLNNGTVQAQLNTLNTNMTNTNKNFTFEYIGTSNATTNPLNRADELIENNNLEIVAVYVQTIDTSVSDQYSPVPYNYYFIVHGMDTVQVLCFDRNQRRILRNRRTRTGSWLTTWENIVTG